MVQPWGGDASGPPTDSTSLDTWQQIDIEPPVDEHGGKTGQFWRPSTASTFGPGPFDPADDAAFRAYQAAQLAAIEPPPAVWVHIPDPRDDPAFEPAPPGWSPPIEGQSRLARNDAAKVQLGDAIARAAASRWSGDAWADAAWLQSRGLAMAGCRTVRAYRDAVCGAYLARPVSCRVRVCPDCERARSARLAGRFAALTLDMRRPVFWTLTVPNVAADKLDMGVDWLLESFRRLRRRAIFAGGPCRGPECVGHSPAAGGVYSIEVTWSADLGNWHPHAHALIDMPWVRWAEMRAAWRAVTCDAIRYLEAGGGRVPSCDHHADGRGKPLGGCRGASVVWVEAVRGAPGSPERLDSIREVLKYTVAGLVKSDGTLDGAGPERLADLLLALRHRRLVAGWGAWRNVTDTDPEDEEPDVLRGPDVLPTLRGLPIACPMCGVTEALWELPIDLPRRLCLVGPNGRLIWRPPRAGPRLH